MPSDALDQWFLIDVYYKFASSHAVSENSATKFWFQEYKILFKKEYLGNFETLCWY